LVTWVPRLMPCPFHMICLPENFRANFEAAPFSESSINFPHS
jgi:hypothetical protein